MTKQDNYILVDRWKKNERVINVKEATEYNGFENGDWNDHIV
jgi:hypothetical protein